jgi:hypothetical protein
MVRQLKYRELDPVRRFILLIAVAIAAIMMSVALYVLATATAKFSSFDSAWRHLVAWSSCEMAKAVGLTPAKAGHPGYWSDLDSDKNGVSCERFNGEWEVVWAWF